MAKRTSKYASMTASQLAEETRNRGLKKPEGMTNISEWADFLEAEDAKEASEVETPVEPAHEYALKMKIGELKELATEKGIEVPEGATKAEIIALLEAKG